MTRQWSTRILAFLNELPKARLADYSAIQIGTVTGWISPALINALHEYAPHVFSFKQDRPQDMLRDFCITERSEILQTLMLQLKQQGLLGGWRGENMAVFADAAAAYEPYALFERTAFRAFGLPTRSVHLNGWVQTVNGTYLWVATRSSQKSVDPGKCDNLVGGGVAELESLQDTLMRESWEEAGLNMPTPLSPQGYWHVVTPMIHGLQREHVFIYDVWLPSGFAPCNQDGEVSHVECLPLGLVIERILSHHFTIDSALVILDGLCRLRFFGAESQGILELISRHLKLSASAF